ncbi:hypothetical protein [Pedobacter antarcticus]|uniref:hypothetical protein n=1 Tax=Pedobacter antarcticus TaxID=34086 RepID=UPI00292F0C89|nr:hypothetical protein [Pedobacter antarcticus]
MEEEESPVAKAKQDMVDRKAAWIERMFDRLFAAVGANPTAALLVLSLGMNFWQFNIGAEKDRLRIQDITSLNEKINLAVEKSVERELPKKLAPYEAKQDSISKNVDTSLYNLNGTVESVKQYIKKKTR